MKEDRGSFSVKQLKTARGTTFFSNQSGVHFSRSGLKTRTPAVRNIIPPMSRFKSDCVECNFIYLDLNLIVLSLTLFVYNFYTWLIIKFCLFVKALYEWNVTKTHSCVHSNVIGE